MKKVLPEVSQGQGVSWAWFWSPGTGGRSVAKLMLVIGRYYFPVVVDLKSCPRLAVNWGLLSPPRATYILATWLFPFAFQQKHVRVSFLSLLWPARENSFQRIRSDSCMPPLCPKEHGLGTLLTCPYFLQRIISIGNWLNNWEKVYTHQQQWTWRVILDFYSLPSLVLDFYHLIKSDLFHKCLRIILT